MVDLFESMGVDRAKFTINNTVSIFLLFGAIFTAVNERSWLESDPVLQVHKYVRIRFQIPICQ